MALELDVNGTRHRLDVDSQTPLLWVLHDELGLTGTKLGCGKFQCGACTVHLDGKPQRTCLLPAASAVGKQVTTIEGLSSDGDHPVQLAWVAEQVPQCGYCQSGQIMVAVALLRDTPHPTDEQIDGAMGPVLCRCGTYPRIRRAIHRAAIEV